MRSNKFFTMLVAVLVIGGAIGGSFIGGLVLGLTIPAKADGIPVDLEDTLTQAREQFASGDFQVPEGVDLDQIRQQFVENRLDGDDARPFGRIGDRGPGADGEPGDASFVGGLLGNGAPVAGTITEIGPSGFTIRAEDGTDVSVTLAEDGVIRRQQALTVDQLESGMQIVAFGEADDGGAVEAGVVQVLE